nr:helix-turn-helix transcriptional regulator [Frankia sp. AgPm24]
MRAVGMSHDEIAIEFARRYKLRPRAAHRVAHGWTQHQAARQINALAARTGIDPRGTALMTTPRLSELENWPLPLNRRRPTPQILALLAEVYGTSIHNLIDLDDREHLTAADTFLISTTRRDARSAQPAGSPAQGSPPVDSPSGQAGPGVESQHGGSRSGKLRFDEPAGNVEWVDALGRRGFTIMAGSALMAGLTGASRARHVDPALVSYFDDQLKGHYRADMLLGPGALTGTVSSQFQVIARLADAADGSTRRRMARVGSSFAAFAAWLWLDAGDPVAAMRYHDAALELAHRCGERDAVACALVDRAMAFTDLGNASAVIDLCQAALVDARRLSPEVRVFALQQQAHGASLHDDRHQVDLLLDQAGQLIDQVDIEQWGTACRRTGGYIEVQRATCYGRLGLDAGADHLWRQIIPAAPPSARRDVGVWLARHAVAAARQEEPERAVELARHASALAVETGSVRARRELTAVAAAMDPWRAHPVGENLVEVLASFTTDETGRAHG